MRPFIFGLAGLTLALAAPAAADTNPSAADIIARLKPTAAQLTGPTRGIRPAVRHAAPPRDAQPAALRVDPAPAPAASELSVKLVVDFRTGSAELSPTAEATLMLPARDAG